MKLLKTPKTYKPGVYGKWELKIERPAQLCSQVRSYASGMVKPPKASPTLYELGSGKPTLWMSLMPMESESQYPHNEHAFGDVVVMGAGLGLLPYNLLQNPRVKSVLVLEKNRDVYQHWPDFTGCRAWPGIKRLTLELHDARDWTGECDTLIADIWPMIGDMKLDEDMPIFRKNVKCQRMMCWGAELSFMSWCLDRKLNAMRTTDDHARQWGSLTGHFVWDGFARYALDAAITSLLPKCTPRQS